jgi:hypothetical protein
MEASTMKKFNRLPREEAAGGPADVRARNVEDGATGVDGDVEGHRVPPGLTPQFPGTGGDFRRPSGGGELTEEDDVEGHRVPPSLTPEFPGTGGDFHRPSGGGEVTADEDVEGHRQA